MKMPRYWIFFLMQGLSCVAFCQTPQLAFQHLGTDDGLSRSNVLCIFQDARGFMWFGTADGLNKYDGYKFTVYKNKAGDKNSISNNYITAIKESKNGCLWLATWGGGLNRYDPAKNQFTAFKHDPRNRKGISSNFITNVLEDTGGRVWVGTENNGLDVLDPAKNQFTHYPGNSNNDKSLSNPYVREIYEDSQHNIWVATNGGLNLADKENNTFSHFKHNEKDPASISSNSIYTIFEDSKQRLWIGTSGAGLNLFNKDKKGFYRFKHEANKANSLSNNYIFAINEDDKNNLWIGTENGGLSILNPLTGSFQIYQNNEFETNSLGNNSVSCIYKDTKHNMWLGTYNAGVDLVSPDLSNFIHYKHQPLKNSLSHNKVLSIYEDSRKNIWIGTDGGGVNRFDPKTGIFTSFRHQPNNTNSICGNYVLSICEDGKGNLWFGTWTDGITLFNPSANTMRHFKNDPSDAASLNSNNAWALFRDSDGDIWIGTYGGGLNLYDYAKNSFRHFTSIYSKDDDHHKSHLSNNNVNAIYQNKPGKLWISTEGGGLNLFDKHTEEFTNFHPDDKKNSISNFSIGNVLEDANKNLWIASRTGLNCLDTKTNLFKIYTTADGLPDNYIYGILEDSKRNLWISTGRGISKFNPATGEFYNFSVADGLQGHEFKENASLKSSSGAMYFGGNNGFNQFFPDSVKPVPFEPPLLITNFQVFNKNIPIANAENDQSPLKMDISQTKEIILPYKSSVFSFEFASLNYTPAAKKQYAYMLEGFDKTWNEIGINRTATYTNLDPGTYIFKARGWNNEGLWSSRTISLKLTITPPFWLTWWFKTLAAMIVIVGAILFDKHRANGISKQKIKLERQVAEQTRQLLKSAEDEHNARREAEQANINLEIKNKELEQFAYIASHDLQEPLRTTSSFAALLQKQYKGQLDDRADKYFNFILDASDRMKILIKNLLDYSRIGNKKELEEVNCNVILETVLADLQVAIREAKADITFLPLPVISGYSTELKQLFQNLIANAIKFRKKEAIPVVTISAQKIKNSWQFIFKDNGIGIEEKFAEKIFVIFQRLHTRTEYEGSGIGLSHCKKIVELHNGKIWVESTPGIGSVFYFTLPAGTLINKPVEHNKTTLQTLTNEC